MDRYERQAKEYARKHKRTLLNWKGELYEYDHNSNEPMGIFENYKEYINNKLRKNRWNPNL